jgi:hypothetical protein
LDTLQQPTAVPFFLCYALRTVIFTGTSAIISRREGKQERIAGGVAFAQRKIGDLAEFL